MISLEDRIYANFGNTPLIDLLSTRPRRILDVGCGSGSNAMLIRQRYPESVIEGVTISKGEKEVASPVLNRCWTFDIEQDMPIELADEKYDVLLFSHVLEHLRDPAQVLSNFTKVLIPNGVVLIAVPNILGWRQRVQFLFGNFEYESAGVLDDTHLRFFTWFTADRYLLARTPELELVKKCVTGSVPLWWLRRYLLPSSWSECIDRLGCRYWPNLFGGQILIKAFKP